MAMGGARLAHRGSRMHLHCCGVGARGAPGCMKGKPWGALIGGGCRRRDHEAIEKRKNNDTMIREQGACECGGAWSTFTSPSPHIHTPPYNQSSPADCKPKNRLLSCCLSKCIAHVVTLSMHRKSVVASSRNAWVFNLKLLFELPEENPIGILLSLFALVGPTRDLQPTMHKKC